MMSWPVRSGLALLVLGAVAAGALGLSQDGGEGRAFAFSLLTGAAFGIVLQRGRFCFFCNLRDLAERGDPRGVLSILVALGVGVVGYVVVFGAWMPVPALDRLPPDAHIGPAGAVTAFAAFVFGVGMTISGSCLSAHLYRLGEGSPTAPFALAGALIGFGLGFMTWNRLFLVSLSEAPVVWLPRSLGYGGWVVLSLLALAALAALVLAVARPQPAASGDGDAWMPRSVLRRLFQDRWPPVLAGAAVGVIGAFAYLRVGPLGVTAELGSLARTAGTSLALLPETLHGLDGLRGCATVVKQVLLSRNGLFVAGLVAGSLASALLAGQFRPARPTRAQIGGGLVGGVLMGWGAMTALGCTVGVLLSGIHAGAVSGWLFLIACSTGVLAALRVKGLLQRASARRVA